MLFSALLGLSLIGSALAQERTGLLVIAGQSNAVGYDGDAAVLPPSDLDKQVLFRWRTGDPPVDDFDNFGPPQNGPTFWTTLQPQPKSTPMPKGSVNRQYGNAAYDPFFGVEMSMVRTLLSAQPDRPIAVLKTAWNGTGVALDWGPDRDCYQTLVAETQAALADETRDFHLKAFVWIQGESDANPTDAPLYEARLKAMLDRYRETFAVPDLPVFLAVNAQFGHGTKPALAQVIEAQRALAKADSHITYIDTQLAPTANRAHFDSEGYLQVGRWLADALLDQANSAP